MKKYIVTIHMHDETHEYPADRLPHDRGFFMSFKEFVRDENGEIIGTTYSTNQGYGYSFDYGYKDITAKLGEWVHFSHSLSDTSDGSWDDESIWVLAAGSLFDNTVNVIVGNIVGLGLGNNITQLAVVVGVGTAFLYGNSNFTSHLGENFCLSTIGGFLTLFNIIPFGMSRHYNTSFRKNSLVIVPQTTCGVKPFLQKVDNSMESAPQSGAQRKT